MQEKKHRLKHLFIFLTSLVIYLIVQTIWIQKLQTFSTHITSPNAKYLLNTKYGLRRRLPLPRGMVKKVVNRRLIYFRFQKPAAVTNTGATKKAEPFCI